MEKNFVQKKIYLLHFTVTNKTFVLSLLYNGDDSYLFVNGKEVTKFKAKVVKLNLIHFV